MDIHPVMISAALILLAVSCVVCTLTVSLVRWVRSRLTARR
jgi:hypothetical protein